MSDSRKPLSFSPDDLSDFKPRQKLSVAATAKAIDKVSSFPSREALEDDQINIKAPYTTLVRFRLMAKAERYKHGAFLEILMDAYEKK